VPNPKPRRLPRGCRGMTARQIRAGRDRQLWLVTVEPRTPMQIARPGGANTNLRQNVTVSLEHRVSADQLIEAWSAAFVPDELLLTELRSLNVSRCLFTNNGPMINHCLQGPLRDLASAFDQVICSWQIGGRKPESVAFDYVQQKLEAPPTTLLVDDGHDNVHAATSHGWQGYAHTDTLTTMNYVRSLLTH
jgi:HAD superfamily hydrolase (TIGR01509 family)